MINANKSEHTRAIIIDHALDVASHGGLESLTIGGLADSLRMSKSGVFARVGSRETLQLAVLDNYRKRFEAQVIAPALSSAPGLPRLLHLFAMSLAQVTSGKTAGCFYFSCASEYDDRPGSVRHHLANVVAAWRDAFERNAQQAIDAGQLAPQTCPRQLVFELYGLLLAAQHDARLLERGDSIARARAGCDRLLSQCALRQQVAA
jgi:AcrR family transcriptional regulator